MNRAAENPVSVEKLAGYAGEAQHEGLELVVSIKKGNIGNILPCNER
jgi:hypothetical protein